MVSHFLKRLGCTLEYLNPQNSYYTHLFVDVALPDMCALAVESAAKREAIAEVVYSFTQKTSVAHLAMLGQVSFLT